MDYNLKTMLFVKMNQLLNTQRNQMVYLTIPCYVLLFMNIFEILSSEIIIFTITAVILHLITFIILVRFFHQIRIFEHVVCKVYNLIISHRNNKNLSIKRIKKLFFFQIKKKYYYYYIEIFS